MLGQGRWLLGPKRLGWGLLALGQWWLDLLRLGRRLLGPR